MSEGHVKESLSAYLDDALDAAARERVDAHLSECRGCRADLDELRKVAGMVAALPKRGLPPGFLTRLKARRRSAEAGRASWARWPITRSAAAFAAVAFMATFVCLREIRHRLAPAILPDEGSAPQATLSEQDLLEQELGRRKRALEAEQSWRGMVADGAAPEPAPGRSTPLAPLSRPRLDWDGAPIGPGSTRGQHSAAASNETLYAHLMQEKTRLGIQEILPAAAQHDPGSGGMPDGPMSKEEAMTAMRFMASDLSKMNEEYRWKTTPAVPLDSVGKGKPRLLSEAETSRPVDKPPADFSKAVERAGGGAVRMARGSASRSKGLRLKRSWAAVQGGMGAAGGAVIRRSEDWKDLWSRLQFAP